MKTTNSVVRLNYKKNILKSFYPVYQSHATYNYLIQGRNSGKTHNMPEIMMYKFLKDNAANLLVFRKYQNTIKKSVWNGILRVIFKYGLEADFDIKQTELSIIDKVTGTGIYFFGLDDEAKIRSTEFRKGYPKLYWFEEFQENKRFSDLDQIDDLIDTFIRTQLPKGMKHQFYFAGNMYRNKYHDFNMYIEKKKETAEEDDARFFNSSYLDVVDNETGESLLSDQIHKKIQRTKERDYDTYLWRYHNEVTGDDYQYYDVGLLNIVDKPPNKLKYFFLIIDTGYQVSATAMQAWAVTIDNNFVLLNTRYYSPDKKILERIPRDILKGHSIAQNKSQKMSPSVLARKINEFENEVSKEFNVGIHRHGRVVDSADGALRNEYHTLTRNHLVPVKKTDKEEMIEISRNLTIEYDTYVIERQENRIFLYEIEKYSRDENTNKVIKIDDHTVDTFQYFAVMVNRLLR